MKKIFNSLIYLIIIIYGVEVLLFIFSSDLQKSLVNIQGQRIEIAKKKNLDFDPRDPEIVFLEKKNQIKDLSVSFYYSPLFSNFKTFIKAQKNDEIIPFRGPINKKNLSCAEDLKYKIINNDKYGFKNLNSIYEREIDVILLGGSFAEGFCYIGKDDIAGNLIKENIQTLNLGVATSGPIVSLAVLKEFVTSSKPKNVFYLYYESNSLKVLNWEAKDKKLIKYLNQGYKLDYIQKIDEIKNFLDLAEKESIEIVERKVQSDKKEEKGRFKNFYSNIQDILEIKILKSRIRMIFNFREDTYNLKLFYETIKEMKKETNKNGGKFTFVYIPSWDRYFNSSSNLHSIIRLREEIVENLKNKNINVIDTTDHFSNMNNLTDYYPLGYIGHFNKKGYKEVADILKKNILN